MTNQPGLIVYPLQSRQLVIDIFKKEEEKVVSNDLSILMSFVFEAPCLNKYLFYCVVVYTDR